MSVPGSANKKSPVSRGDKPDRVAKWHAGRRSCRGRAVRDQPSGPRERAAPGLGTAPGLASAFDTASGKTANNPLLAVKENHGYGQARQHCRSRKITPQVVLLIEILLSPHGES